MPVENLGRFPPYPAVLIILSEISLVPSRRIHYRPTQNGIVSDLGPAPSDGVSGRKTSGKRKRHLSITIARVLGEIAPLPPPPPLWQKRACKTSCGSLECRRWFDEIIQ